MYKYYLGLLIFQLISHGCDTPTLLQSQFEDQSLNDTTTSADNQRDLGRVDCSQGSDPQIWYLDQDQDGLGDGTQAIISCDPPDHYVSEAGDPAPNCSSNEVDDCGRCDGDGPSTWYADQDQDGRGDPGILVESCEQPMGFVDVSGDRFPNCMSNQVDECGVCDGVGRIIIFADQDGDGLGDDGISLESCTVPNNFVTVGGDPEPLCTTNDTDSCGVCAGEDHDKDCLGVCFGRARYDTCDRCIGGLTGLDAAILDDDRDGIPNLCDQCLLNQSRVIVQWDQMYPKQGMHGPYTFQLILYEDGSMLYMYHLVEPFDATNTVGYQGPQGNPALTLGQNSQFILDQRQVFFEMHDEDHIAGEHHLEVDYSRDFKWLDIKDIGQYILVFDDAYTPLRLPFDFTFFGQLYRDVAISDNGILALNPPYVGADNTYFPQAHLGGILSPFWDDFDPALGGGVYVYEQEDACSVDCHGDFGGVAYVDDCGVCVGGRTALMPNQLKDCNGECNGEAHIDFCGICSGGLTGVPESTPEDCPYGPDLIVDQAYLSDTLQVDYLTIEDECLIREACISGLGLRKLLRFGTRIANLGNEDLRLGAPNEDNPLWYWDECHGHFHFNEYARYELFDLQQEDALPLSAKAGFAVIDIGVYDPEIAPNGCNGYNSRDQGITAGCQDTYSRSLQCQWVDITDLTDGEYRLTVTTNPNQVIRELNYQNNAATVHVRITGDQVDTFEP